MNYKVLGKTGLKVSEIGFGGEWLERHPEEESIELMKYASEKGINIIDCWMPDPKSRDIIGKAKLKGFNFNHGTGHGIGLNVHEMPPVLSPSEKAKMKLKSNMVFSIEPGMYKEKVGGVRIENSVCTIKTKSGIKIQTLTNLPFDEKLINFDMLTKKELKWYNDYQNKALK